MQQSKVATEKYNGWKNYPTWTLALWLDNTNIETYEHFRHVAKEQGQKPLQDGLWESVWAFSKGERGIQYVEAIKGTITDWLMNSAGWVEWYEVVESLQNGRLLLETDEFTSMVHSMLTKVSWQEIIAGAEYEHEKDEKLRDWLRSMMDTWVQNKKVRQAETPLSEYCKYVVNRHFSFVDWGELTERLKEE